MAESKAAVGAYDADVSQDDVEPAADDDDAVGRMKAKVAKIEAHLKGAKQALADARAEAKKAGG